MDNQLDELLGTESQSGNVVNKKRLDSDTTIYVTGILSLIFFIVIPVGTIMAIFSLVRANEEMDDYRINPGVFYQESIKKVRNGKMMSIISLALQGFSIFFWIFLSAML